MVLGPCITVTVTGEPLSEDRLSRTGPKHMLSHSAPLCDVASAGGEKTAPQQTHLASLLNLISCEHQGAPHSAPRATCIQAVHLDSGQGQPFCSAHSSH